MSKRLKKINIFNLLLTLILTPVLSNATEYWTREQYIAFFKSRPLKQAYKEYMLGKIPKINFPFIDAHDYAMSQNIKVNSKWYNLIDRRLYHENDYANNSKEEKTLLFHIREKRSNDDINMSYVNPNKLVKVNTTFNHTSNNKPKIDYSRKISKDFNTFYTAPKINRCDKPFHESVKLPNDENDNEDIFDTLILSNDVLQYVTKERLISEDFFGDKSNLRFYSSDSFDPFSYSLKYTEIKCLPIRIRVKNGFVHKYYGLDALKNYDFNENGELHYKVKKIADKLLLKGL